MFKDRTEAGRELAALLRTKVEPPVVVLAVVRGGVVVGVEVARAFEAPFDICLVKKIGAPFNPEFAIGAVSLDAYDIAPEYNTPDIRIYVQQEVARMQELLRTRAREYRQGHSEVCVAGSNVVIVDDGVATGRTFLAAIKSVAHQKPKRIIAASPVMSSDAFEVLAQAADSVISVLVPESLYAIGAFYQDFHQLSDQEVKDILTHYWKSHDAGHASGKIT